MYLSNEEINAKIADLPESVQEIIRLAIYDDGVKAAYLQEFVGEFLDVPDEDRAVAVEVLLELLQAGGMAIKKPKIKKTPVPPLPGEGGGRA